MRMNIYVADYWRTELTFLGGACIETLAASRAILADGDPFHADHLEARAIAYAIRAAHAARQLDPWFRELV